MTDLVTLRIELTTPVELNGRTLKGATVDWLKTIARGLEYGDDLDAKSDYVYELADTLIVVSVRPRP